MKYSVATPLWHKIAQNLKTWKQPSMPITWASPSPSGYSDMMSEAGFSELVAYARTRPHPKDLRTAMPDELVYTISLVGSEAAWKNIARPARTRCASYLPLQAMSKQL